MGLRLDHLDDTQRLEAWARIIKRIYDEQVEHAWGHYMFRLLRAVFSTNPWLSAEGGFIFEWMVRNYVDANLMLLRRELDIQNNTENLRNLLLDMCDHPTVITRASYLARWGPKHRSSAGTRTGRSTTSPSSGSPATRTLTTWTPPPSRRTSTVSAPAPRSCGSTRSGLERTGRPR